MPYIVAHLSLRGHGPEFTAVASVLISLIVAWLVDRVLLRHERRVSDVLTPATDTRLRILRRVTSTAIIVTGVAIGLTQFAAVNKAAAALLASGAIAAAVLGFAARQTLANAIAGILIAVAQPLRIGDLVTFEGETGIVEDVRLTYTFLRTSDDVRIVIPNERIASGVLRNASIVSPTVGVQASLWLARDADAGAVVATLARELPDSKPRIAEVSTEGVRIVLSGEATSAADRDRHLGELLGDALRVTRTTTPSVGRATDADGEVPS
jgi:small conductance mechanosensitive channel